MASGRNLTVGDKMRKVMEYATLRVVDQTQQNSSK
jgi:hypothetical protein